MSGQGDARSNRWGRSPVKYDREVLVNLLYQMTRIRKVELYIESLYHQDEMKTPIHLCIGQEAVAVGVCAALNKDDYVSSNHRGHGHYLAKDGDLEAMIAELYCRESGCSKGRGGSMHLVDTSVGLMGSSSIVGGGIPLATGLGLAIQLRGDTNVSVVFFGDGAADEGVLYESVNFAVLKRLPVVFVYENNQFSVCSRVTARQHGALLFHYAPDDLLPSKQVDGNSVLEVYEAALNAVTRARSGEGPSFLECVTYRMRGHAGSGDSPPGYRSKDELVRWEAQCPLDRFRQDLYQRRLITQSDIRLMESGIDMEIREAFRFARESELPSYDHLPLYLFRE